MNTKTGLSVYVLRDTLGDCTNGGLTSRFDRFVLLGAEGPFEPSTGTPELKLVRRVLGGKPYYHAEPPYPPRPGHVGWMAGGNFVYSSDSRFSEATDGYPIAVHDREETPEQYRALSI